MAKKGFVLLGDSKEANHNNFSAKWKLTVGCCTSDRYFPIRWKAAHFYNSACSNVLPVISSAFRAVLSATQRENFVLHDGSEEQMLGSLTTYGLSRRCVPTSAGGVIDKSGAREAFLQQRQSIEGSSDRNSDNGKRLPDESLKSSDASDRLPISTSDPGNMLPGLLPSSDAFSSLSSTSGPAAAEANANARGDARKGKAKTSTAKAHPGQRGDDRMNRAVDARMSNGLLSYLAALTRGGYEFPGIDKRGVKMADVVDLDGVTFYQVS